MGNLGTECISEAQTWLSDKLTVLKGPQPHMMYSKDDFGGMLFAEFQDQYQRDLAVTLLKTAGIQYDGKPVWAAPDRNPVERAARNFCFGLKRVFKVDWKIPYTVQVNDQTPYTVTVGGELALTAHVSAREVVHEWHGEWVGHMGRAAQQQGIEGLVAEVERAHCEGVSRVEGRLQGRACLLGYMAHGHKFGFTRSPTCCFRRCTFGRWWVPFTI